MVKSFSQLSVSHPYVSEPSAKLPRVSDFHTPFSDRSSRWFRLRRYIPRFFLARRSDHLTTRVFTRSARATDTTVNRRMLISGVIVVLIAAVGGFVFFSGFFSVTRVSVVRNSLDLPIADIEKIVSRETFGQNLLLVDTDRLRTTIKKLRPDIALVSIVRQPPATLSVEILKYPVVAELRVGSDRIFINENGYRVEGAVAETGILVLTLGETIELADANLRLVEPAHLTTMKNAVDYAETLLDTKVTAVRYFPVAREARLKLASETELWLDLTRDYRGQLDKLMLARDTLNLAKIKYLYLDLRVTNKIFYKKK